MKYYTQISYSMEHLLAMKQFILRQKDLGNISKLVDVKLVASI